MISRRKALSMMGLAASFGLAGAPAVLTTTNAEAQTPGMERREGRQDRREERRTGTTTGTGANTGTGTTTGTGTPK